METTMKSRLHRDAACGPLALAAPYPLPLPRKALLGPPCGPVACAMGQAPATNTSTGVLR